MTDTKQQSNELYDTLNYAFDEVETLHLALQTKSKTFKSSVWIPKSFDSLLNEVVRIIQMRRSWTSIVIKLTTNQYQEDIAKVELCHNILNSVYLTASMCTEDLGVLELPQSHRKASSSSFACCCNSPPPLDDTNNELTAFDKWFDRFSTAFQHRRSELASFLSVVRQPGDLYRRLSLSNNSKNNANGGGGGHRRLSSTTRHKGRRGSFNMYELSSPTANMNGSVRKFSSSQSAVTVQSFVVDKSKIHLGLPSDTPYMRVAVMEDNNNNEKEDSVLVPIPPSNPPTNDPQDSSAWETVASDDDYDMSDDDMYNDNNLISNDLLLLRPPRPSSSFRSKKTKKSPVREKRVMSATPPPPPSSSPPPSVLLTSNSYMSNDEIEYTGDENEMNSDSNYNEDDDDIIMMHPKENDDDKTEMEMKLVHNLPSKPLVWVNRSHLSKDLRKEMSLNNTVMIEGNQGCGKTALAIQYAWKHASQYTFVWWFNEHSFIDDMINLADRLGLLQLDVHHNALNHVLDKVYMYLSNHPNWLFIIDGITRLKEFYNMFYRRIPTIGHLLLTHDTNTNKDDVNNGINSLFDHWYRDIPRIRMNRMDLHASEDLFLALQGKPQHKRYGSNDNGQSRQLYASIKKKNKTTLPRQLPWPLSLQLASGYMDTVVTKAPIFMTRLRDEMQTRVKQLRQQQQLDENQLESHIVSRRIVNLSVKHLRDQRQSCVDFLYFCSLLANEPIPYAIIQLWGKLYAHSGGLMRKDRSYRSRTSHYSLQINDDMNVSEKPSLNLVIDVMKPLETLNLIHVTWITNVDNATDNNQQQYYTHVHLHTVVRQAMRETMTLKDRTIQVERCAELCSQYINSLEPFASFELWSVWRRTLPHFMSIMHHLGVILSSNTSTFTAMPQPQPSQSMIDAIKNVGAYYHQTRTDCIESVTLIETGIRLLRILNGKAESDTVEIAQQLLLLGRSLLSLGNIDEAVQYLQEAVNAYEPLKKDRPGEARALSYLSSAWILFNNSNEALRCADAALKLHESCGVGYENDIIRDLMCVAAARQALLEYTGAIEALERANILILAHIDENSKEHMDCLLELARAYWGLQDEDACFDALERSLNIAKKLYGKRHMEVAKVLNILGSVYEEKEDFTTAIKYYTAALGIIKIIKGENQDDTATSLSNLGRTYDELGRFKEAVQCFKKCLKIQCKLYGNNSEEISITLNNIGLALCSLGEASKSIEYYERAISIQTETYGMDHYELAPIYNNIGTSCHIIGLNDEAIGYFAQACSIARKIYGENAEETQLYRQNWRAVRGPTMPPLMSSGWNVNAMPTTTNSSPTKKKKKTRSKKKLNKAK